MSPREKVKILLVDDQPERLLSYEAILGDLDQCLVRAKSGVEALERLMKDDFAVILLDVSMPGMNGFETASLIHKHPRFEKTPIIFVTGLPVTDLDRMKGYELGAVDYVQIPIVPQILRSKIAVLVELYLKRLELHRLNLSLAEANEDLKAANSTLQAQKANELTRLNENLERANGELAQAIHELQSEIATREQLEQTLREADRRKDEFLALLSHELRNPLAPIQNAVQLLHLKTGSDSDIAWCRDVIERQCVHLVRLVDDLLDVSRISQGKVRIQKEPVDLSTVITHAIELNQPQIDARRHEVKVELPPHPVHVLGDATRVTQALGNLISNAVKYSEDGASIRIVLEHYPPGAGAAKEAVIRVIDSGVGIPPDMLPHVFELFMQVERGTERLQGGLGIGLALVHRLVELHGGRVTAHSEGVGRGSEFIMRLPALNMAPPPMDARARSVKQPQGLAQGRRVLVADDNLDSAQSLAMLLRTIGTVVEVAYDGMHAVEVAEQFRPDAVLLDLGMPKLDGYGAARRIREQPWGRDILLIALTGWGQKAARDRTREAGFDSHLVKPVEFAELTKLLAGRRASDLPA
jgi:signal transduction histidine kinase